MIVWINEVIGWGIISLKTLRNHEIIDEYVGEVSINNNKHQQEVEDSKNNIQDFVDPTSYLMEECDDKKKREFEEFLQGRLLITNNLQETKKKKQRLNPKNETAEENLEIEKRNYIMMINERQQQENKKNLRSSSNNNDGERNYDEKKENEEEVEDIVVEDRSILIDASLKGNFTRFINHSQSTQISPTINSSNFPSWRFNNDDDSSFVSMTTIKSSSINNLETINVRINFKICQIFLQTKKVINRHEELRFDYWE